MQQMTRAESQRPPEVPQSTERVVLIVGHSMKYIEGVAQALYYLLVTAQIEDVQLRLKQLRPNKNTVSDGK